MSPLRSFAKKLITAKQKIKKLKIKKLKTKQQNPSPNPKINILHHAHDAGKSFIRTIKNLSPKRSKRVKGISVLISASCGTRASMTVEASLVLPLFLFFFLNLSSAVEIIRLHGNLEMALWETGNRMCVYGYALSAEKELSGKATKQDGWWHEISELAFSYSCLKGELVKYAGRDYLDSSPLTYGADGLQFVGSDVFSLSDQLEIVLTYQISPMCSVPGFRSFLMENHYYGHLWTGYEIPGTGEKKEEKEVRYYVAENGEVYHLTPECSHLKLTKKKVSLAGALAARNNQGQKYTPCRKCRKQAGQGDVWISKEGEHYHYSESCPGLKRTIYVITEKEAAKYRPCKRCAGKAG